jgi:hypothetical protein
MSIITYLVIFVKLLFPEEVKMMKVAPRRYVLTLPVRIGANRLVTALRLIQDSPHILQQILHILPHIIQWIQNM